MNGCDVQESGGCPNQCCGMPALVPSFCDGGPEVMVEAGGTVVSSPDPSVSSPEQQSGTDTSVARTGTPTVGQSRADEVSTSNAADDSPSVNGPNTAAASKIQFSIISILVFFTAVH